MITSEDSKIYTVTVKQLYAKLQQLIVAHPDVCDHKVNFLVVGNNLMIKFMIDKDIVSIMEDEFIDHGNGD